MNHFIELSLWAFPASILLAITFILALFALHNYYNLSRFYRALASIRCTLITTLCVASMVALEGIWSFTLYHTWPFIIASIALLTNLGLAILKRWKQGKKEIGFMTNHLGLFLIGVAMLFGAPDYQTGLLVVNKGASQQVALGKENQLMPLPFAVQLEDFNIEYYDDGITPQQFRSIVTIKNKKYEIAVNEPIKYKGYDIYQSSYDKERMNYAVLQVVYDPWIGVVWIGITLLALGAIIMIFKR
ncbi:MAG: cytochrome c biogenesis protein ResB [Phocaeicola sp.]